MSWQDFEKKIRDIARYRWGCAAEPEVIAGVQCDCVLKPEEDRWIAIEITEEKNLAKVREDCAKLVTVKNTLLLQSIHCRCYMVMKDTPTQAMRGAGKGQRVDVLSAEEFQNAYFNYGNYVYARSQRQFGSLVNVDTGEPEANTYIEVTYVNKATGDEVSVQDIISMLKARKKVLLKGDFGLGKSRCVKQIFDTLTLDRDNNPYTIAVNLREAWGMKRGREILTRHFEELTLDPKSFLRMYESSNIIYLLDGFDEIGTQSWDSDPKRMHHIREMSVCALKDLITQSRGGVLITGREYYFNSDTEMLQCLGLREDQAVILECHPGFSEDQLEAYMTQNLPEGQGVENISRLPEWFPRRPLVIQLLLQYAKDILPIDGALDDIYQFWHDFLTKICEREATIFTSLNPETIRGVLIWLANRTRVSDTITQGDLADAFEALTGTRPNDESNIILQRLPTLGRVSAESPDRQFMDPFILDALRVEGILQIQAKDAGVFNIAWKNPLDSTGCSILAKYIGEDSKRQGQFLSIARNASNSVNGVLASDIVASLCLLDFRQIDFKGLAVSDGHFRQLSFMGKEIRGLSLFSSVIGKIDLTNAKLDDSVLIEDCIIDTVYGIASHKSLPPQFKNYSVDHYEPLATLALIKRANLSDSQKLFLEIIHKIFFQRGSGRKEEALHRGMGASRNKQLSDKILNLLLKEGIVTRHKGDDGWIYNPVGKAAQRMEKIRTDLTLSEDPLWTKITALKS